MTTKVCGVPAVQVMALLPLVCAVGGGSGRQAEQDRMADDRLPLALDLPAPRASSEATAQIPCDGFQTTRKTRFMLCFLIEIEYLRL